MNINKNSSLYYIASKWGKGHPHNMDNLCLFMRKVFLGVFKIIVFYLFLLFLFLSITDPVLTFFMNLYFDLEFEYFYAKFFYVSGEIIYIVSLALSMVAVIVSSYGSSIEVTRTFSKINHIKKDENPKERNFELFDVLSTWLSDKHNKICRKVEFVHKV